MAGVKTLLLLLAMFQGEARNEEYWTKHLAPKYGVSEENINKTLWDGSRVDLLSDEYAIEVDWAHSKWKESIGQSLLYSALTGKKPAVILLVRDRKAEAKHVGRCRLAINHVREPEIALFIEFVDELSQEIDDDDGRSLP